METVEIRLPPKLVPVFSGSARYRGAYGGRGSAKTRSFALMTAVRAYQLAASGQTGIILCGREYVNSLDDSSLPEIKAAIEATDWLSPWFDMGEKYIRTRGLPGRIDYKFAGLRHNIGSLKSKARIFVAWVDEAEDVSEAAWRKLIPTVREDGSEIWVTWNSETEGSPTDERFRRKPPSGAKIIELNYGDNPWFPAVLEDERLNDLRRLDPNTYAHIWEGAYLTNSDRQVFAGKWAVEEFLPEAEWDGPYQGGDFGFSQDPAAAVRVWINGNCIYVEHEAGKTSLELDQYTDFISRRIPGFADYVTRWDSSQPGNISFISRHGLPRSTAVEKWQGSVEDGVAYLRSFQKIIVHPRCTAVASEMRLYSHKVDRMSGDILPDIVDAHNHYIDAIRYAIAPMIKRAGAAHTQEITGLY